MAIVGVYQFEQGTVYVHDDYMAKTPEEIQAVLDNVSKIVGRIALRQATEARERAEEAEREEAAQHKCEAQ